MESPSQMGVSASHVVRWLCMSPLVCSLLVLIMMCGVPLYGQSERLRVVSYNVENLYDTKDDPLTDDAAFLSDGSYHWVEQSYRQKLRQTARVLADIGEWTYPALIGLVEVENHTVVRDLITHELLRRQDYRMAVTSGADPRGVDLALLWHPKHFRQVSAYEIPHYGPLLSYPLRRDPRAQNQRHGTGRSTLWVVLESKRTGALLDVLVVHLPSRRGGVRATAVKRGVVAARIRTVLDSIRSEREQPRIVVMGDFNDHPGSVTLMDSIGAYPIPVADEELRPERLYNLATPLVTTGTGPHYHEGKAWVPDQILVSGALLDQKMQPHIYEPVQKVYQPEYLREGQRPKRSFRGNRYVRTGYSDHYPVYIDLIIN